MQCNIWLLGAACLAGGLTFSGCKTTDSSKAAAFTINGDAAAAHQAIITSVVKSYPTIKASDPALSQFATALQDGNTEQAASSDYVLQLAYSKLASADPAQSTEFDTYVAMEFAALTNYTSLVTNPDLALQYIGTTATAGTATGAQAAATAR